MRFSICTSVSLRNQERVDNFLACIKSVRSQTFKDFEWVIVDDGSTQEVLWEEILKGINVKLIHKEHAERVIGYNWAFKKAKGEWITLLDSDDEYVLEYLETLDKIIKENPTEKLFNFGAIYRPEDGTETKRAPFIMEPHQIFGGGNIVWGTFAFHRSIYKDLGAYPPEKIENVDCTEINYGARQPRNLYMNTPFDFSAYAQIEYPELRQYFMVDHEAEPEKIIKELGNPWGNDFYLYYKYTRKYVSKPIEEYLYVVHPRK